jgi:hypothetical protein
MNDKVVPMPVTVDSAPPAPAHEPMYVHLAISDPEVILAAGEYPEGRPRTDFIQTALKIGVLSLRAARGVVDGDAIRREGENLMTQLGERLNSWRTVFEQRVSGSLSHYFDPKQGMFVERVERLVKDDGDLAGLIRGQVQQAEVTLKTVFQEFIGENSHLLKVLDPSGENQLVVTMQRTLDGVMQAQNLSILQQFSLDNKDSALNRFLGELGAKHGDLHAALKGNMAEIVAEFSLDRKESALSRLVESVESTQRSLSKEFSLDNTESALSRLQGVLDRHHEAQMLAAGRLAESLNVAIAALHGKKEEAAKSTRHGVEFEAQVGDVVRSIASAAGDVVQDCGTTTGVINHCKVGDFVVTVGPEKAAAGAKIVIEAKESASYDLSKSLEEADLARRNRGAGVCVFVHSEKTAPSSIQGFARYGHDIVVRWDAENEGSDLWIKAALMVATAMSVRAAQHDSADAASFQEVDKAIEAIRKQIDGFDEIATSANTSSRAAGIILKRAEIMKDQIVAKMETLCEQIAALKARQDAAE